MGRNPKPTKLSEMNYRLMRCKCGEPVEVRDDNIISVTCCYCASNTTPVRTPEQFEELIALEDKKRKESESEEPKKRGRPRKNKETVEVKKVKKKNIKKYSKKGNSMNSDNMKKSTDVKTKGKRGRKPSVGKSVYDFISKHGQVNVSEIYDVYSAKLKDMGKEVSADRQKRNLFSTLYILEQDGKIKTVEKRSVYSVVKN
jgi:hypothetical protein